MFGKLLRKRNARRAAEAQGGERPKGLSGIFSRGSMPAAGRNFSNPKMMADMAAQASANMPSRPMAEEVMVAEEAPAGAAMMRKGGKVKKKPMAVKKMAKGGSASRRADGCATKGKTKGKFV